MSARGFGAVLLRRARTIARRRAEAVAERLAGEINANVPGVSAERTGDGVRLRGRGLARRWITDAALRWLGRLLR